jgi:hypothetical protein
MILVALPGSATVITSGISPDTSIKLNLASPSWGGIFIVNLTPVFLVIIPMKVLGSELQVIGGFQKLTLENHFRVTGSAVFWDAWVAFEV